VDSWNTKGGAPSDVYKDLKNEKSDLSDLHDKLEKERVAINNLIGQGNNLAQKEQSVVNNYNASLNTYKDKYGQASQFDKGVYDGTKIDIFQFNAIDDLRLTIVHELGHALGMDHVENPQSIMYYLMGEQNMANPQPSAEDIAALKNVCQIK
jgi:predicted Zn-dependent protease